MSANKQVEQIIKQHMLTVKAGEKKSESVSSQKRQLLTKLLSNKKVTLGLILCNQKRSVSSVVRHIEKKINLIAAPADTVLEGSSKKILSNIEAQKIQFIIATHAQIKDMKLTNIDLIVNFDLPTKESDYTTRLSLAASMKPSIGIWSFISPEDKKCLTLIMDKHRSNIRLARLKGHHNVHVDIDFSLPHPVSTNDDKKEKQSKEVAQPKQETPLKVEQDTPHVSTGVTEVEVEAEIVPPIQTAEEKKSVSSEKVDNEDKKRPRRQRNRKEKIQTVQADTDTPVDASPQAAPNKRRPQSPDAQIKTEAPKTQKARAPKQEKKEHLPKKTPPSKIQNIVIDTTEPATQEENIGPKLNIEVKEIPKPQVRRNPQGRIIGMGDHVPNFMLHDIIFNNSVLSEEE